MEEQSSPKTFIEKKAAEDGLRVLNYAKGKPRRWRRVAKRIVVIGVLIGLCVAGWRYGPHVYLFARERYWQRACMNFEASPETVVYDRLPAGSSKPAITSPYMDGDSPELVPLRCPRLCAGGSIPLKRNPFVGVHRVPVCWTRFLQATHNNPSNDLVAVVFCHQRVSRGGHQRLVTVEFPAPYWEGFSFHDGNDILAREMRASTYDSARWEGCPPPVQAYLDDVGYTAQRDPVPQRVFAGQVDPADASHFTIEYEWPDKVRGVVDGWLLDNGQVRLATRPGPGDIYHTFYPAEDHPELWYEWVANWTNMIPAEQPAAQAPKR